tara:strand:+ start:1997 stop:2338 length:342 start_codon:yes stop_codon:yes gene_type:complete
MPRIKNLPTDNTINNNDKLLGTDGVTGNTKNYLVSDLKTFIRKERLYTHNQAIASTTWTINHNLDTFPSVSIKFSSSDEVYENVGAFGGVTYTNSNTITITLAAAESGYAYLN